MRAKEIQVGGLYEARVSARFVPVQILEIFSRDVMTYGTLGRHTVRTFYRARNTVTGREIEIRSPQRLRRALT